MILRFSRTQWRPHPRGLLASLGLVAAIALPVGVVALFLCGLAQLGYRLSPEATYIQKYLSVDFLIVLEQLKRARSMPAADLLFIGDSSCLMGIDATRMRARLPGTAVESLCSIAYVGPAGYAQILRRIRQRGAMPKILVIAMHPVQFQRHPSWESWVSFVSSDNPLDITLEQFPSGGLDFFRIDVIGRLLFQPLPGNYGRYFGDNRRFAASVSEGHGSTLDPGAGMQFLTLAAFEANAAPSGTSLGQEISFATNEAFELALDALASELRGIEQMQTFLLISPFPDASLRPDMAAQREAAARLIARRLSIPTANVLPTATALPSHHFSSSTHLNRWGRALFTNDLARQFEEMGVLRSGPVRQ